MLSLLFALSVLLGFVFWFMATWPVNYAERIARGCFLVAAVVWTVQHLGLH